MAKVEESCACGATFKAEMVGWYAEINLQRAARDWRDAHKVCRERIEDACEAQSQDTKGEA